MLLTPYVWLRCITKKKHYTLHFYLFDWFLYLKGGGNSQCILFYEKNTSTLSEDISLTTSSLLSLTIGVLLDICVKPIVMHSFKPIIQYKSGTVKYRPLRIVEPFSTFSTSFRSTSDVSCCKSKGFISYLLHFTAWKYFV